MSGFCVAFGAVVGVVGMLLIPISVIMGNSDINYPTPALFGIGMIIVAVGMIVEMFRESKKPE